MILPGVTRDSILLLARAHADPATDYKLEGLPEKFIVTERDVTMPQIVEASKNGSLMEMFGSGTVSPIFSDFHLLFFLSQTDTSLGSGFVLRPPFYLALKE